MYSVGVGTKHIILKCLKSNDKVAIYKIPKDKIPKIRTPKGLNV